MEFRLLMLPFPLYAYFLLSYRDQALVCSHWSEHVNQLFTTGFNEPFYVSAGVEQQTVL
jgi:hypothetical protein